MILTRQGNKRAIAKKIISFFTEHKKYIELFFGAGGLFFMKPKAEYNILNDIDDEIFNLFMVLKKYPKSFKNEFLNTPVSQSLFNFWKKNKENNIIKKAVRFVFLSNFSYLSARRTFSIRFDNAKNIILKRIPVVNKILKNCKITNLDYRDLLKNMGDKTGTNKKEMFIYADPPYLNTDCKYSYKWQEKDVIDLFESLINFGCNFAISEFDNPFILELCKKYNLNVIELTTRRNLKNYRKEILIINYKINFNIFEHHL